MRKGIAMLEVLAIGGIITLSAATIAPFVTATEHASTLKCAANGKKIMAGLQLYMADWDGRFPSSINSWPSAKYAEALAYLRSITWKYDWEGYYNPPQTWNASGQAEWRYVQLKNYVKDDNVWVCCNPTQIYLKRFAYGFRMNWVPRGVDDFVDGDRGFQRWDYAAGGNVGLTIAEVEALDAKGETKCGPRHMPPCKKIIMMEYGLGRWANSNVGNPPGVWPWVFPAYPHEGGSNFGYADGHVSWKMIGQGWAPIGYTSLSMDQSQ